MHFMSLLIHILDNVKALDASVPIGGCNRPGMAIVNATFVFPVQLPQDAQTSLVGHCRCSSP